MMRMFLLAVLLAVPVLAQADKKSDKKVEAFDFRPLADKIMAAWSTLDPEKAAPFYDKGASRVFYDIMPLKYTGWTAYNVGVKQVFADYSSANLTLNPDFRASQRGSLAWATSTAKAEMTRKNGVVEKMDLRWTVLWQKTGEDWLIIHEHVSAPLAPPSSPPPAKPAAKKK